MIDIERSGKAKQQVIIKRDIVCNRIRQVHSLSIHAVSDSSLMQQLFVAAGDLDDL